MPLNISKFLEQFFLEAKEKLSNIQNHMVEIENNPGNKDAIVAIQRDMHTIKGSSRMVGLAEISEIAHQMEDVFFMLHNDQIKITSDVMDILYQGIDTLSDLLQSAETSSSPKDFTQITQTIHQLIEGKLPSHKEETEKTISIPVEEEIHKKKFILDFKDLKQRISGKAPEVKEEKKEKPTRTLKEKKEVPVDLETQPEMVSKSKEDARMVSKKEYLKVDSDKIEKIVNQVADVLSKKYLFTNISQTFKNLSQISSGFREEWDQIKNRELTKFKDSESESIFSIDNMLDHFKKNIQDFQRNFQYDQANYENNLRDLYENLLELKMTPLSTIFNIYPRFVRDYAYRSGKKIRIFVRGGDTQLDKTVVERINEPLIHLIRNACDHGIELPKVRKQTGKNPEGTIIIEANKRGNRVEIKISDDGCGLNRDKILKTAIEKELIDKKKADQLEDSDIFDFIFEPGFSTAHEVSATSGRGIGMDIVKKILHQFGGSLHIQTHLNKGTIISLEFPITILTNRVTTIEEEGKIFAIPSHLIRCIVNLNPGEIKQKSGYSTVLYNDEIFTVAKLNQILTGETAGFFKKNAVLILPKVTDKKIGIIVDNILNESDVIIKGVGDFLGNSRFVYGMTVGEKGELQIVLDLHDLVESSEFFKKIKIIKPVQGKKLKKQKILLVDDSLLVREMEKNLLESAGYEVIVGVNGIDGYNKAISDKFDLILADIEMPEMDGFEMIENIKKIKEYEDVPTIVLSTSEKEEDKIRGIKVGANAWLQKQDFDGKEFLKTIKSFIG